MRGRFRPCFRRWSLLGAGLALHGLFFSLLLLGPLSLRARRLLARSGLRRFALLTLGRCLLRLGARSFFPLGLRPWCFLALGLRRTLLALPPFGLFLLLAWLSLLTLTARRRLLTRCGLLRRCPLLPLLPLLRPLAFRRGLFALRAFLPLAALPLAWSAFLAVRAIGLHVQRRKSVGRGGLEAIQARKSAKRRGRHQQAQRRAGQNPWVAFHCDRAPVLKSPVRAANRLRTVWFRKVSLTHRLHIFLAARWAVRGADVAGSLTFSRGGNTCPAWRSPSGRRNPWRR